MILYKYTRADIATGIIRDCKIRYTQLNALNDPFESYPPVSGFLTEGLVAHFLDQLIDDDYILQEIIDKSVDDIYSKVPMHMRSILTKSQLMAAIEKEVNAMLTKEGKTFREFLHEQARARLPDSVQRAQSELVSTIAKQVAVLSLSTVPNSEVMWSHYADVYRGVVLGFDTSDSFLANIIKVKYQPDRPELDIKNRPTDGSPWKEAIEAICGIKNEAWAYEQEYRLTSAIAALSSTDQVDSNGAPIFLGSFPPSVLSTVIFGSHTDASIRDSIAQLLKAPHFNQVKVQCAFINPNTYQVTIADCK